jgi:hypothetical protein
MANPLSAASTQHIDTKYVRYYLEYTGSIRCPPGIQKVVLSSTYKPFACRRRVLKNAVFLLLCDIPRICFTE